MESWRGVGARAAQELLLLLGFASLASVFFLLRGVAATASGCGLWASSQDSVIVSSPRSGLVCCLVQWYCSCSCRCRAAVRGRGRWSDGLAWSLCGLPPRTRAGAGARCSWVGVAGVVRLGGGYRGDGNKAVVDERATIYKAGFVWLAARLSSTPLTWSLLLPPRVCSAGSGGCLLLLQILIPSATSRPFGAVLSASDGSGGAVHGGAGRGESEVIPVMG